MVRLADWPEMLPFVDRLPVLLEDQGSTVASFGPAICLVVGTMDRAHRDPFNRLLAATARQNALPLVSADTVFDGVVTRIW